MRLEDQRVVLHSHDRRLKSLENIQGGKGITVQRTPGGVTIHAKPVKTPPAVRPVAVVAEDTSGGIVLELHPEWVTGRQYRLGERCVHAVGDYYSVYQCAVAHTAGTFATDLATKWTDETNIPTLGEWAAGTTYTNGQVVMWGTPWQFKLYTAHDSPTAGTLPSDTDHWTAGADVVLGIKEWPTGTADTFVPFREYVISDVRYDTSTYLFQLMYSTHTFDKGGNLKSVALSVYSTWAEPAECVPA